MNLSQTPLTNTANLDLLKMIPSGVNKVIEVGCGSGALAREFKKNNQVNWIGLEIDPFYAVACAKYCDEVFNLDIELAGNRFFDRNRDADVWIFADVLEHLRNPWAVLNNIRSVIKSDGMILACIPNVQHWSFLANVSTCNFSYKDSGLFDKTHLRWFTRKSIIDMFDSSGFGIDVMRGRALNSQHKNLSNILDRLLELSAAVDPHYQNAEKDFNVFQWLVKSHPK